jgi:hypothetical protein
MCNRRVCSIHRAVHREVASSRRSNPRGGIRRGGTERVALTVPAQLSGRRSRMSCSFARMGLTHGGKRRRPGVVLRLEGVSNPSGHTRRLKRTHQASRDRGAHSAVRRNAAEPRREESAEQEEGPWHASLPWATRARARPLWWIQIIHRNGFAAFPARRFQHGISSAACNRYSQLLLAPSAPSLHSEKHCDSFVKCASLAPVMRQKPPQSADNRKAECKSTVICPSDSGRSVDKRCQMTYDRR